MSRVLNSFYGKYRMFRNKQLAVKAWREAYAWSSFKFVIQVRANLRLTRLTLGAFRCGCLGQVSLRAVRHSESQKWAVLVFVCMVTATTYIHTNCTHACNSVS